MVAKKHFPNLDALRFFAALFVIISHHEENKLFLRIEHFPSLIIPFFSIVGLNVFFVLSGFLITYLLIHEYDTSNTISMTSFYLRRIFRIWPLYFVVIFISTIILPSIPYFNIPYYTDNFLKYRLYALPFLILILPNLVSKTFGVIPHANQTWSIGSEEQFYLIWPVLVKRYFHNLVTVICIVILLYMVSVFALNQFVEKMNANLPYILQKIFFSLNHFWASTRMSVFGVGSLIAYIYFYQKLFWLKLAYSKLAQILSLSIVAGGIIFCINFQYFGNELYAVFVSIIVLNLATNPKSILVLDNHVINYLGKISYGLYMYHNMILFPIIKLTNYNIGYDKNPYLCSTISFLTSLFLTILISHLSFKYLEKPLIGLRIRLNKT